MHPVIHHLLERRGKKVPTYDHRRISLVLFGGLMTGARGAGALLALEELRLTESFDRIYALSAGLPNAAYFLTHNIKKGVSIYYEELCSKEFLNFARFWDVVDIEYVMHLVKHTKPLDHKKISLSSTRLYTRLLDTHTHKTHYMKVSGRNPKEIETIIRAATSIPFLNPGSINIGGIQYKDGGTEEYFAEAIEEVLTSDATDVLIIYNHNTQYERVKKHLGVLDSQRILQIVPYKEEELGHFCRDPHMLKTRIEEMSNLTKSVFGDETKVTISTQSLDQ